ncbi:MAG: hypothetical protein IJQ23_01815 [Clostridia bacterium]|nr:hypothetical protein [Clostridia bacterium]
MLKVLKGSEIIDALAVPIFVRYQPRNGIIIQCEENVAQGVLSSDGSTVYQIEGRETLTGEIHDTVAIAEISQDEFETIKSALDALAQEKSTAPEGIVAEDTQVLSLVLEAKIKTLSNQCAAAIKNGFDIILSDGLRHRFSLSLEDQINMLSLKDALAAGEQRIAYHGVDEPYQFFTDEDIERILEKKEYFKNYNLLYFNSLKKYVCSLSDVQEINAVEWGSEVPEQYKTAAFKEFLEVE